MRRRLLETLFGLLLLATPLSAQAQTYDIPSEVETRAEERSVWKEWLIGSIFLVGCLVVAFKPAKRADLR